VIAIDSFKALSAYAATPQAFRHFLHELAGMLTALPTTAFWVGEYGGDEIATAPEFAVALDESFYELLEVIDRTRARRVCIDSLGDLRRAAVDDLKTRASRHDPDIREFKITSEGIVLDEPQSNSTG
jgi:hypothetical protein